MATNNPSKNTQPIGNQTFLFDKSNYMWMIGGVVLILIGFMLMAGGKSPDPHVFNREEIYSFRRITLAPIIILLGFGVEIYAIMRKPKEDNTTASND
jgi:predicted tellurium resistance membrane protein TerC